MSIYEIKILLAVYVGNEELVLKNASGKKLADSNNYFVVTDDGNCHLFDANGKEKDVSIITELVKDIVSKDIKKIVIPESVTSIEDYVFYYCNSLTSVTIPNSVMSIGKRAFDSCNSLTSVVIPDSATSIKNSAFCQCRRLMNVTIGKCVTTIGSLVFFGCDNLKSLIFKEKSIEEVKAMKNYPFGIKNEFIIRCIDETHDVA